MTWTVAPFLQHGRQSPSDTTRVFFCNQPPSNSIDIVSTPIFPQKQKFYIFSENLLNVRLATLDGIFLVLFGTFPHVFFKGKYTNCTPSCYIWFGFVFLLASKQQTISNLPITVSKWWGSGIISGRAQKGFGRVSRSVIINNVLSQWENILYDQMLWWWEKIQYSTASRRWKNKKSIHMELQVVFIHNTLLQGQMFQSPHRLRSPVKDQRDTVAASHVFYYMHDSIQSSPKSQGLKWFPPRFIVGESLWWFIFWWKIDAMTL